MQHQQHDWFMTTLVNCVKTKNILLPSEARPHTVYIYILEYNARWLPKARRPKGRRPIAVHILLVLKTPIEVYNY